MRIAGVGARPEPSGDVAAALITAVTALGQRPAITDLRPDGRREQGFTSLAGWVAKGANLLAVELGLGPGDRLGLAGPPGWPLAAVALSAWWVGATVVPARRAASGTLAAVVLHVGATGVDASGDVLWFGDELDGTGRAPTTSGEQWADALAAHADRPPPASHDGTLTAFASEDGDGPSQRELLARLADDPGGALGIVRTGDEDVLTRSDGRHVLAALALRPLVTGAATVVMDAGDPERDAHARAERVVRRCA
jgi:hypothetical protein